MMLCVLERVCGMSGPFMYNYMCLGERLVCQGHSCMMSCVLESVWYVRAIHV